MPEATVSLRGLSVRYGEQTIVKDISFDVSAGEIVSLLGVSGSGKSTILRTIAGFVPASKGTIHISGQHVTEGGKTLIQTEKRRVGMMFQEYALFPYMTVAENVAFGMTGQPDAQQRVTDLLELVGITELADRKPATLSGGQQQRVALVRALAPRPGLLLLDEPFANLDGPLRREIGLEVRRILKHEGISAILVTHDRQEALSLSDRVGVLADETDAEGARLLQYDTPSVVYRKPAAPAVATLTGPCFLMKAQEIDGQMVTHLGPIDFVGEPSARVQVAIRPHQLRFRLVTNGPHQISEISFVGPGHRCSVQTELGRVWFDDPEGTLSMSSQGQIEVVGPVHGWPH